MAQSSRAKLSNAGLPECRSAGGSVSAKENRASTVMQSGRRDRASVFSAFTLRYASQVRRAVFSKTDVIVGTWLWFATMTSYYSVSGNT